MSVRKGFLEEEKAAAEKRKQKCNKDTVTQPQRVYYGLINQGATCYLNSVLQVLFMTTEIHNRLDPKSQILDQELRNIFQKLKKTTCGTENITKRLQIKNVSEQRDAAECLEIILRNVSPQVSEVFLGQLTYTTKCSKHHIINEEINPFWTLPLTLKDGHDTTYSVERGFERIFQTKSFNGDNMVYCNDCKKKAEAIDRCEMVEFPWILILLLKRFDFDYNIMSHVKSNCCVDVPRTLQRKNKKYKLYGMVNHYGSLGGGHYTATILCNEDKTWYEFDDTHIKQVKEQPFAKTTTYKSSTAYLLVYRVSGSLRDKVEERQNATGHLDEPRGCKMKRQINFEQREADDKETRPNQENHKQKRKEGQKEEFSRQGQGGNMITENSSFLKKQNTSNFSKQHPDSRTKTERMKPRSKGDKDEKYPQTCSSTHIMLLISLCIAGCLLIGMLLVILITLT